MKRQMKIAAVVSATALLAIGASFTSMAAAKTGTWQLEDGVWYCYDKDGDVIENEFCLDGSNTVFVCPFFAGKQKILTECMTA